jgi:uncharacterized membrane protein YphA (DoxX/SURF4 family)
MTTPFLIGRLLFGGYFMYGGINHFRNHPAMTQYASSKKVPRPEIAVAASGAMLLAGGASIAAGIRPHYGAAAIVAFLGAVSPAMHDFWRAEDPNQKMSDTVHFGKNLALLGGALAFMGVEEPWPASIKLNHPSRMERLVDLAKEVKEKIAA